jgi:hypothetical protein
MPARVCADRQLEEAAESVNAGSQSICASMSVRRMPRKRPRSKMFS